jgi:hypothetical protein
LVPYSIHKKRRLSVTGKEIVAQMIRIKLSMVAVMLIAVLAAKDEAMLHCFQGGSCGDSTNTALPAIACEAAAVYSHREHHMHQHSSCHCSTFLPEGSSVVEMMQ